jgi:hypothetical protein
MNKVHIITANQAGQLVSQSGNPEFGYMRVEEQTGTSTISAGWLRTSKRSALIKDKYESLVAFVQSNKLVPGSVLPIEGKILIKETTEKSYDNQQPKRAGAEGEILKMNGQPIYRETVFSTDQNDVDVLITHDAIVGSTVSNRITMANPNVI